ncbi:EamA family transporter [Kitasatospora sp. NPDC056651]|uniref:EamA family transporter n=1 Tax=Kitasatospora sp. NPDC056651 TaxID=3345892 RepID=UPI003689B3E6
MSAMVLGAADFTGGLATKHARATSVVFWSNVTGLVTALALAGLLSTTGTSVHDAIWGSAAGLCGSIGAVLLYRALASGVMSLVAPTTAAAAAALPVIAGVLTGNHLTLLGVVGIATALVAVLLVSLTGGDPEAAPDAMETVEERARRRSKAAGAVVWALLAGTGFGLYFVFLQRAPTHTSLWPLVWTRCASLTMLLIAAVFARRAPVLPRNVALIAPLSGLLDMASSALYLVAVRNGTLAVIGLLASLYPVSTVLLARIVLKERIRPVQHLGVVLALGSVVLLAWN